MRGAIEEHAAEELDALWQTAMFLNAGNDRAAQELVVRAVSTVSFDVVEYRPAGSPEQPLERHLVRLFVRDAPEVPPDHPARGAPKILATPGASPSPAALFAAAGTVPPIARAAIWLVMLRRRSYEEAATLLDIDREELRNLLRFRDAFIREVLGRSRGRRVVD